MLILLSHIFVLIIAIATHHGFCGLFVAIVMRNLLTLIDEIFPSRSCLYLLHYSAVDNANKEIFMGFWISIYLKYIQACVWILFKKKLPKKILPHSFYHSSPSKKVPHRNRNERKWNKITQKKRMRMYQLFSNSTFISLNLLFVSWFFNIFSLLFSSSESEIGIDDIIYNI